MYIPAKQIIINNVKETFNRGAFMKLTFKPDRKYKIQSEDEMQLFLHMKRKGASTTKNKKVYNRKQKHRNKDM